VTWRIVAGTEVGDLVRLQSLAEQVFGAGDRRPQWFVDKLDRECVDPALTQVAMLDGDPIGYALVGRPPSSAPILRAAGTAVLQAWRGRGIASAMLDAATQASAGAPLELWAQDELVPFYASRGFALVRSVTTLLAFARGTDFELPPLQPWSTGDGIELHAYLEEAWTRTNAARRHTLVFDDLGACVHVCREGRAFALHRTVVRDIARAPEVFDRVLERLPTATPVVAIALPDTDVAPQRAMVSSVTHSLRAAGWVDIQRSRILRRAGHLAQRPR